MIHGVVPALPTFFKPDYSFDLAAMHGHVERLLQDHIGGVLLLGGVGEFLHLKTRERRDITADVAKRVGERVPLLVGTGSASTLEAIELTQHAAGVGASAAAILTPSAWHLDESQLVGHFATIATAVDLPIFLYNLPRMTGTNLRTDTVCKLMAEHDNIVGLIDVTDSLSQLRQRVTQLQAVRPDSVLIGGRGEQLLDVLLLGGHGVLSGTANITPRPAVRLYEAYQAQDAAALLHQQRLLLRLAGMDALHGAAPAVLKAALAYLGLTSSTTTRPPAFPLSAPDLAAVHAFVDRLRETLADDPDVHLAAPEPR